MDRTSATITLLIAAGMLAVSGGALRGQSEAQPPRSLDERLLEDLGADPWDDLDRELFAPGGATVKPGDPPGRGPDDLGARLRRELPAAGVAEDDNPLLNVARRMRDVEGRIAGNDSGLRTQGLQRQIIDDLDRLIEQARKSCRGSKPGSKSSKGSPGGRPKQGTGGTKPGQTPSAAGNRKTAGGQNHKPDRQQMRTMMQRLWEVTLPPQQREQLLQQSPFDEFLPKYELLIEQYFRRLSEEDDE